MNLNGLDNLLAQTLDQCGLQADEQQLAQLSDYLDLLVGWNSKMNLSGARNRKAALELCLDSLHLAALLRDNLPLEQPQTWDLGAGAGLPGIPLRIFWQHGVYTMVEARQKRSLFLKTCLARLNLPGTKHYFGRAEQFMPGQSADLIVSRAFLPQAQLLDLVLPHLAASGQVALMSNLASDLPANWRVYAEKTYASAGQQRCIRLLALA